MYPWAVSAQCFSQSYFILLKALSSYDHFGMKEGNLTATLWDPFRCVQVKTENSPALPLFSCRSASFSLWGRDRFAVPAVTQAKGCSHLLLPFPQWAVSEGTSQALPLPPALDGHSGKRRMKPSSHPGPLGQVFLPRADPGATQPPKSRAATDCWREDKVGWEPNHAQQWVIITCCSKHVVAFSLPTPCRPTTLFC